MVGSQRATTKVATRSPNKQITGDVVMSPKTVAVVDPRILTKLGVPFRNGAAALAVHNGRAHPRS